MENNYQKLYEIMEQYLPKNDIEDVKKAYIYAHNAHEGQIRKSGEPYIIHPLSVAIVLAEQNLPKTVIISGLLHDVVEDTDKTYADLVDKFGIEVADIVEGVTKLGNIPGLSPDQVKAENHRKIIIATAKDVRVILVKLADRVHNMSTIKYMNESKQKIIASETLEVYTQIAHKLGMYRMKWELEDLSFKVLNKRAYDEIASKLQMKRKEREEFVNATIDETKEILKNHGIEAKIVGRSKHIYSIYKKMKNKNKDFEELTDLFAFRIIVKTEPECYTVLGFIHQNFKPIPLRFKDYIPTPKHNMYQSIHTTVINEKGIPVEFQIRTTEMDVTAEYGIAAHWMYKEGIEQTKEPINYGVDWLSDALKVSNVDNSLEFMTNIKNDILGSSLIVYTPKGDVVELPEGATVLDFAYYIHTRVGNQAVSAKVNNKVVSLFYPLQIGDVVHVITSDVATPSISYIQRVRTSRARESIRKYFKNMERQSIRNEGSKLLVKYAMENGIDNIKEILTVEKSAFLLVEFVSKSLDDFLYAIGIGAIQIEEVVSYIKTSKSVDKTDDNLVLIKGASASDDDIKMCRFCSPIYGDEITATLNPVKDSKTKYHIHRPDCAHAIEKIDAIWNEGMREQIFLARISLDILDIKDSIVKVISAISKCQLNITSIYFRAGIGKLAAGKISVEVTSVKECERLLEVLSSLDNVYHVERTYEE